MKRHVMNQLILKEILQWRMIYDQKSYLLFCSNLHIKCIAYKIVNSIVWFPFSLPVLPVNKIKSGSGIFGIMSPLCTKTGWNCGSDLSLTKTLFHSRGKNEQILANSFTDTREINDPDSVNYRRTRDSLVEYCRICT